MIAYRGLFLIDKEGIVRHQLVNFFPIGRNVDEAIRVLDAWIHNETHGEVCPANWEKERMPWPPPTTAWLRTSPATEAERVPKKSPGTSAPGLFSFASKASKRSNATLATPHVVNRFSIERDIAGSSRHLRNVLRLASADHSGLAWNQCKPRRPPPPARLTLCIQNHVHVVDQTLVHARCVRSLAQCRHRSSGFDALRSGCGISSRVQAVGCVDRQRRAPESARYTFPLERAWTMPAALS